MINIVLIYTGYHHFKIPLHWLSYKNCRNADNSNSSI